MFDLATNKYWPHISTTSLAMLLLTTTVHCDDEPSLAPEDVVEGLADTVSDSASDQADLADTEEDVPPRVESERSVRFDLTAALEDDFFAFPYPSDLRVNETGAPDLASFPTWYAVSNMVEQAAESVETSYPGFSPLSAVYIGFNVSLDPDTLPADVASTIEPSSSVYLIDISNDSPSYGQRQAVTVSYNDTGGGYWSPRTLTIHPLYGLPLRTDTTYAAVVTDAVLDVDGNPLDAPTILSDLG